MVQLLVFPVHYETAGLIKCGAVGRYMGENDAALVTVVPQVVRGLSQCKGSECLQGVYA